MMWILISALHVGYNAKLRRQVLGPRKKSAQTTTAGWQSKTCFRKSN